MKIRATFELVDANGGIITSLGNVTKDCPNNQNQDLEYELVYNGTGGPLVRPKQFPKF